MPYVTSVERLAKQEGREEGRQEGARAELLATIRSILKDKFGSSGSRLMRKVKSIDDLERLRKLFRTLIKADTTIETVRDLIG